MRDSVGGKVAKCVCVCVCVVPGYVQSSLRAHDRSSCAGWNLARWTPRDGYARTSSSSSLLPRTTLPCTDERARIIRRIPRTLCGGVMCASGVRPGDGAQRDTRDRARRTHNIRTTRSQKAILCAAVPAPNTHTHTDLYIEYIREYANFMRVCLCARRWRCMCDAICMLRESVIFSFFFSSSVPNMRSALVRFWDKTTARQPATTRGRRRRPPRRRVLLCHRARCCVAPKR